MINKGFSLFVYTLYLQQYIDIVRCVIFLLFLFLCIIMYYHDVIMNVLCVTFNMKKVSMLL